MGLKTIKGVNEKIWNKFKSLAVSEESEWINC